MNDLERSNAVAEDFATTRRMFRKPLIVELVLRGMVIVSCGHLIQPILLMSFFAELGSI